MLFFSPSAPFKGNNATAKNGKRRINGREFSLVYRMAKRVKHGRVVERSLDLRSMAKDPVRRPATAAPAITVLDGFIITVA